MPITWSAENELKLATAIIALHQVKLSKDDHERLAAMMGHECTGKAISHRVAKFKEAAVKLGLQDSGTAIPPSPASAKKRGRKAKANDGEDEDRADPTPTKKGRTSKTIKSASAVKEEAVTSDETVKKEPSEDGSSEVTA